MFLISSSGTPQSSHASSCRSVISSRSTGRALVVVLRVGRVLRRVVVVVVVVVEVVVVVVVVVVGRFVVGLWHPPHRLEQDFI